jgi:hypothetical protein
MEGLISDQEGGLSAYTTLSGQKVKFFRLENAADVITYRCENWLFRKLREINLHEI